VMTVERGVDPRELALLCFGGRGRPARRRHRRGARDDADPVPARVGRAGGARARRLRPPPRRPAQRPAVGEELSDERCARRPASWPSGAASSSATPRPMCASPPSCATAGRPSSWRSTRTTTPASCARPSTPPTRRPTGFRDPEGEVELVTLRATATEPGPGRRRRRGGAAAAGAERSTPHRDLRRRGARDGVLRGEPSRARRSRARRWSSCPSPRSPCRRAGRARCSIRHDPLEKRWR
jgi:N-methylhydantoinase A